jgi:hypothetical protein
MNPTEFYNYIVANFTLDGASCRLIRSILDYVAAQGFGDEDTNYRHLCLLLDGTIGLSDREIKLCHF